MALLGHKGVKMISSLIFYMAYTLWEKKNGRNLMYPRNLTLQIFKKYISRHVATLTLSQCTLAGTVYTGMPLECHRFTQCTLGYHWVTHQILARYTGTPLEKFSWNRPTLECHWRNLVEFAPHWDATGEKLTFAAYTGTPLEGLWQPTHASTHIVKHAE